MTAGQMELPLSTHSSPADPTPEQKRTHPAQMVIKHCAKQRNHVSHAYKEDDDPFGCPGTPDLRERDVVEQQAREAAARVLLREASPEWKAARETDLRRRGVEDVDLPDD